MPFGMFGAAGLRNGVSKRGGGGMFANKTRILLTFREDALGRARVFPGLKLAEHRMRFANACKSASGSGEIRSGGGWRLGGVLAERSDERRGETFCREDGGEG
jgi:hypothetical protein